MRLLRRRELSDAVVSGVAFTLKHRRRRRRRPLCQLAGDGRYEKDCALSVLLGLLPICTPCFIIWQKNTNGIASSIMMLPFVNFFMWLLYSWKGPAASFNVNLFCCVLKIIGILTFILYSNTATGRSLLFLFLWLWLVAWGLSSLVPSPMLVEWWWRFAIFRWVWSSSIQFLDEHIFCL